MTRLPEHPLPAKPLHGAPCNGCGLCCHLQLCPVGQLAFPNVPPPCPALRFHKDRTACGFVEGEIQFAMEPMIQKALGIGTGCSMDDQ